jgi:uncharacterized protein YaaN involved in tellurite resistance
LLPTDRRDGAVTDRHRQADQATPAQGEKDTAMVLPEPAATEGIVSLDQATPEVSEQIRKRMAEIDLSRTGSIVAFGSKAQEELQKISQSLLQGVRNKDLGPAGSALREIVSTIRGFSSNDLNLRQERSLWDKLTGKAAPIARFTARFEEVQEQIDRITSDLLRHEHQLLKDVEILDQLYNRTLAFHDELALYIAAGDATLRELDAVILPATEREVRAAGDDQAVLKSQNLRDLRAVRDDLERRVHDLKLTRQVTMQSLPSIRLVQGNDKSLVAKINSTLVNTVPLWEQQLAQAVTLQRSTEAAAAVRDANDLTNELLTRNAENLRQANHSIRIETERSVFDIEAVRAANEALVATISDSLQIADQGKARRAAAEAELERLERELKYALASAKSRVGGAGESMGSSVPH